MISRYAIEYQIATRKYLKKTLVFWSIWTKVQLPLLAGHILKYIKRYLKKLYI